MLKRFVIQFFMRTLNEKKRKKRGFERLPMAEITVFREGRFIRIPRGRIPKKEKREPTKLISVRLPRSLLEKIDDYAKNMMLRKGEKKERSLAIRCLLDLAFATIEKVRTGEIIFTEDVQN